MAITSAPAAVAMRSSTKLAGIWAGAAVGEVVAVADQTLMQLAGEQGDAVHASVVTKPVAGDAHLPMMDGEQHLLIEIDQLRSSHRGFIPFMTPTCLSAQF
jgi:hypothetical protein